jgi:hypothetical protein
VRAAKTVQKSHARALAGAKFRAWWDGAAFDEAGFLAKLEQEAANPPEPADVAGDLFDPPVDPRLEALQRIWGAGRLAPGSDPLPFAPGEGATIALLGPGLAEPAMAFAAYANVHVFEWRSETREALKRGLVEAGLDRAEVTPFDLDLTTLAAESCDAVMSFDEFTYASNPARLALQIARTLKPGAKAVIETYAGASGPDLGAAFASAFAEPQLHARNALTHSMNEAGLDVDADEDISAAHIAAARGAFERFTENAAAPDQKQACAIEVREIGWEIHTWRARLKLLALGRIQRHRFTVHRRV